MCLCLAFMKWTWASSQLGLMENVSLNGFNNNNNNTTNINTIRQDLMSMDNNSHIMGDRSNSVAGSRRCYCSLCGWMSPSKPPRPETVYFPYQIGGDWWSVCLYAGIYATIAISNPLNMFGLLSWLPAPSRWVHSQSIPLAIAFNYRLPPTYLQTIQLVP